MTGVTRGMPNWKAVGPDSLPAEPLKLDHPEFIRCFHILLVNVENGRRPPTMEICYCTIKALHTKKDRSDCNNYRMISRVVHSGQGLLKIFASRLSNYCKTAGILPEEQCGFRPARSTVDMLFVVRRLQVLGRARKNPPVHVLLRPPESA